MSTEEINGMYQGLPKSSHHTPLLHLQPDATDSLVVHCQLVYAQIDHMSPPEYEALSYQWGRPNVRNETGIWHTHSLGYERLYGTLATA